MMEKDKVSTNFVHLLMDFVSDFKQRERGFVFLHNIFQYLIESSSDEFYEWPKPKQAKWNRSEAVLSYGPIKIYLNILLPKHRC